MTLAKTGGFMRKGDLCERLDQVDLELTHNTEINAVRKSVPPLRKLVVQGSMGPDL